VAKFLSVACAAALLGACAASQEQAQQHASIARGYEIVESHCASCHAVGRSGESAAPEAPAFRRLSQRYPVDTLEEAFAEGISVGHPAMPQFQFAPDDVHALVSYLQSIQEDRPSERPPNQ